MFYRKTVLDNGLKVLVREVHTAPLVSATTSSSPTSR